MRFPRLFTFAIRTALTFTLHLLAGDPAPRQLRIVGPDTLLRYSSECEVSTPTAVGRIVSFKEFLALLENPAKG
jgi:hypothetical protein